MTAKELIKALSKLPEDKVCILVGEDGGWCNIEEVTECLSTIEIVTDCTPVFTSDRD